jgi:hypothetical protein
MAVEHRFRFDGGGTSMGKNQARHAKARRQPESSGKIVSRWIALGDHDLPVWGPHCPDDGRKRRDSR